MDPTKKRQLAELRKDRTKLIGKLREQLNSIRSLEDVKLLLWALVSLQEVELRLEEWADR